MINGRHALFVLGRVAVAGQRRGSVFLSVAVSVSSVAGDDGIVLCLSEVRNTRYEELLHSSLHVLGCQVKGSFEEALE